MADSIIERAALLACKADFAARKVGHEAGSRHWSFSVVRAVLQAIREPSEAMLEIGANCASTTPLPTTAGLIWQAMIEAALGEDGDHE